MGDHKSGLSQKDQISRLLGVIRLWYLYYFEVKVKYTQSPY